MRASPGAESLSPQPGIRTNHATGSKRSMNSRDRAAPLKRLSGKRDFRLRGYQHLTGIITAFQVTDQRGIVRPADPPRDLHRLSRACRAAKAGFEAPTPKPAHAELSGHQL